MIKMDIRASGFVLLTLVSFISGVEFPPDVPRCKNSDTTCLSEVITKILMNFPNGHTGLNLVQFDPLHIKQLVIGQNPNSPVNIQLKFSDVDLTGISKATIFKTVGFDKDILSSKFEVYLKLPYLSLIGPYTIRGSILILPITGSGMSNMTFENVQVSMKISPQVDIKDGKEYLQASKMKIDILTTRLHCYFENLFNGDKALGDSMNLFLNENWQEIYSEVKPSINIAIAEILAKVANGPLSKVPYNELFLQ